MIELQRFLLLLFIAVLTSCMLVPANQRSHQIDALASSHGWQKLKLITEPFTLVAYVPEAFVQSDLLTVYIEGDGLAWLSNSQPSPDPTPLHAIGLELALKQPEGVAVYLARPCQYQDGNNINHCTMTYWTDRRFSSEVIASSNHAITQLMQRFHATKLELVGYSGGGAIATLVAAQRHDVLRLITVAGNLDHQRWTELHLATPLKNSLNPADAWENLLMVPQLHYVGGNDHIMSHEVAESYQSRFPKQYQPELHVIDDFDHVCCWVERWSELYPSKINKEGSINQYE